MINALHHVNIFVSFAKYTDQTLKRYLNKGLFVTTASYEIFHKECHHG